MTEYVVLREIEGIIPAGADEAGGTQPKVPAWREFARVEAVGSGPAIRQAAGEQEGTYIAVPVRSFVPLPYKRQTSFRLG